MLVPPGVVAVIATVPVPGGATAVTWVSETTVKEVAGVAPNRTAVVVVSPVPVSVTVVPPAAGPELGLTEVRTGTDAET